MGIFCAGTVLLSSLACVSAEEFSETVVSSDVAQEYEAARALLKEEQYGKAAEAFDGLGNYAEAPRYAMYCRALEAAESGLYSTAVTNLENLTGFLDSSVLCTYYTGRALEEREEYEEAEEILGGIVLFRDVADRVAAYPALIQERDYKKADQAEKAGRLEIALRGFRNLKNFKDSAERAEALQEKINERGYAAADQNEADGKLEKALEGFGALGDYKDSKERAEAVQEKILKRDYQ